MTASTTQGGHKAHNKIGLSRKWRKLATLLIQTIVRKQYNRLLNSAIPGNLEWPLSRYSLLQAFSDAIFRTAVQQLTGYLVWHKASHCLYASIAKPLAWEWQDTPSACQFFGDRYK